MFEQFDAPNVVLPSD